jgi:hypothetical protein
VGLICYNRAVPRVVPEQLELEEAHSEPQPSRHRQRDAKQPAELTSARMPRLAFRVCEAAHVLGVSPDFFAKYVSPELRWVRRGAVKLVSREELEAWLNRSGERTLADT